MTVEEERRQRNARRERLKAEHKCVNCGKQDERTIGGMTLCVRCSGKRGREMGLAEVLRAHGYKVSAPEPERQDDGTDMDPGKMAVLSKYGYDYSVMTGRWTTAS